MKFKFDYERFATDFVFLSRTGSKLIWEKGGQKEGKRDKEQSYIFQQAR